MLSYMGNWVWYHHDYSIQSEIFLRLHAKGFNQSINWFEQDCVDFSPASFYRAMNHSHFPEEIEEKLVGRCKIPTDNIYSVFNQDWPFCLRTLYVTIVSISQKLHTGTCISLIQQFCNIYKKKKRSGDPTYTNRSTFTCMEWCDEQLKTIISIPSVWFESESKGIPCWHVTSHWFSLPTKDPGQTYHTNQSDAELHSSCYKYC